tara:strand:+ start:1491 stop:2027 length:537 start_codon:yes stop_codon:yes gene_type:complete
MKAIIQAHSGEYIDLENPHKSKFLIEDIAHGLANTCRFGGQCSPFYSVAQHCVHVSLLVPPRYARAGLLHDGAEAYVGDVSSPLKALLANYQYIEEDVQFQIWLQHCGQGLDHPEVKKADLIALATERRDLMPNTPTNEAWSMLDGITPDQDKIEPWGPYTAKEAFLARHRQIVSEQD